MGKIEDPLSLNLYTYCANNPLLYIDPSGHWPSLGGIIGGIVGGIGGAVVGGLVGGPVGAVIGAIGGAVVGGIVGEKISSSFKPIGNGQTSSNSTPSTTPPSSSTQPPTSSTTTQPPAVTTTPAISTAPEKVPTTSGIRQKQLNFNSKLSDEKKDFASGVFNSALLLESKIGVPAEIVTAQACLESGWGENVPVDRNTGKYSYNIFGIKGTGTAGSVNCRTREVFNGESIYINDDFAAYNNFEECLAGYDDFLTNRSLYSYDDLFGNMNVNDWAYGLQSHHYATDPDYPDLLLNIINDWLGVQ